jgi:hypothetical protein
VTDDVPDEIDDPVREPLTWMGHHMCMMMLRGWARTFELAEQAGWDPQYAAVRSIERLLGGGEGV